MLWKRLCFGFWRIQVSPQLLPLCLLPLFSPCCLEAVSIRLACIPFRFPAFLLLLLFCLPTFLLSGCSSFLFFFFWWKLQFNRSAVGTLDWESHTVRETFGFDPIVRLCPLSASLIWAAKLSFSIFVFCCSLIISLLSVFPVGFFLDNALYRNLSLVIF